MTITKLQYGYDHYSTAAFDYTQMTLCRKNMLCL